MTIHPSWLNPDYEYQQCTDKGNTTMEVEQEKERLIWEAVENLDLAAKELKSLVKQHERAVEFYKAQHQLVLSRISEDCVAEYNRLYGGNT
tara:strand:+ start:724 stop:996 length:273 start_codon:yes stop_codon:yes gene_type:complete